MIPFKKINLGNSYEDLKPYFDSGFIGLGDAVFEFEKALAEYTHAKYALALNSCTSALFLSLLWERRNNGLLSVEIPSMTVPLVVSAIRQAKVAVKFNDDVSWVGTTYRLTGSHVIDSAHELRRGSFDYRDDKDKLCFSFYPTKTIGSADGGAIVTNDKDFIDWARKMSVYGRNQTQKRQNSWDYEIEMLGCKLNWNNLQAVIALEQLKRLDESNKRRREIVRKYNNAFGMNNDSDYLYRINVKERDSFIQYMLKQGVECGVHFKPLHLMKPFSNAPVYNRSIIEEAYSETVSIPLYDLLTDDEVDKVIKLVLDWRKTV